MNNEEQRRLSPEELQKVTGLTPEEIKRQSTAVINACQYSLIFSLSPNDVNDLIELYKNSGGINKEERNRIVSASVGQAFVITSPTARTMVQIHPLDYVVSIFKEKNE